MLDKHDTIGIDLVAMCVNDLIVQGAEPLFFLDYYATGSLNPEIATSVIEGIGEGCRQSGCSLIGGETAEMPDIYKPGEFDLAGTIVGIVDENEIINGDQIKEDSVLIGFKSSGLHTNGYSLARNVLFSTYKIDDYINELGTTLSEELLKVHKSYLNLITELKKIKHVQGFSHITGGGIIGNTKRIVPNGLGLDVTWDSWERPSIYSLIQDIGNVPEEDMRATFNLGIGLIAIVDKSVVNKVLETAEKLGEPGYEIGRVKKNQ
jgi:phosphoribosylformylglycinamidine cyclo-ligase